MAEKIHESFNRQITTLATQQGEAADASLDGADRTWMLGYLGDWTGDPFDIANLGKGFSSEDVINAYTAAVAAKDNKVKGGEIAALRLQYEILMAGERALRLRHASSVRSEMFAAGRRRGLGNGGLQKVTVDHIQSMLKAAQA